MINADNYCEKVCGKSLESIYVFSVDTIFYLATDEYNIKNQIHVLEQLERHESMFEPYKKNLKSYVPCGFLICIII